MLAEARLGELFNALPKAHAGGWAQSVNLEIPPAGKSEIDESESEADEQGEKPKPKLEVAALVVDERRLPRFTA